MAGDSRFADLGSVVGEGISEQCALEAAFEFWPVPTQWLLDPGMWLPLSGPHFPSV